jgi:hypothetical protein
MAPLPFLAALLCLAAPSNAAPSADQIRYEDMGKELMKWVRFVKNEQSALDMANELDVPPPSDAPVKFLYNESHRISYDCDGGISAGEDTALATWDCGENGVIAGGTGLWRYTMLDKKMDDDRLAFILAHEIGHHRFKHVAQRALFRERTRAEWMTERGDALRADRLKRELSRYSKNSNGVIPAADELQANKDADAFVESTFVEQRRERLAAWARKMEKEADDYAGELMKAAGRDPAKMAGAFSQTQLDIALVNGFQSWEQHTSPYAPAIRDEQIFEKYVLPSK